MTVRVLYFAWLRERIGCAEESVALAPGVATAGALADWLASRGGGHAAAFADRGCVRIAVNQEIATADSAVKAGDEVAFFPPVTGG